MKKIAVVNDLSGFGRCSLTAAIPVISAHGIQCCPLVTGVFSNQTGYDSFYSTDFTDGMLPSVLQWEKLGESFDAILTGFISNAKQVEAIETLIEKFKKEDTLLAVDPVMADDGQIYKCYDESSVEAIKSLAQKADLITPNLTELCILSEESYDSVVNLSKDELFEKVREMSKKQCVKKEKTVVTSGIHFENKIANAVYQNGKFEIISSLAIGESFSGTGDIFSSFITAQCVNGVDVCTAAKKATRFIYKSIEETVKDTNGKYNTADGVHFERFLSISKEI